jgi:2-oxo-3-hexenedioate decarboxylase
VATQVGSQRRWNPDAAVSLLEVLQDGDQRPANGESRTVQGVNQFGLALRVELLRDGEIVDRGEGSIVLDGPIDALRQWVDAMHSQPQRWPIRAGDVVTTGTITDAWPMKPGMRFATHLSDPRLAALTLECAPS